MSSLSSDFPDFIDSVECLLEHGPSGQNAALGDLRQQLENLEQDEKFELLEKTIQILGTAVGQESKYIKV